MSRFTAGSSYSLKLLLSLELINRPSSCGTIVLRALTPGGATLAGCLSRPSRQRRPTSSLGSS
jgi:hypothetical protein